LGIIFCNTQRMVDDLADALQTQGISADRLHGGIPQAQRTRVMNKFKNAEFEFLVATDVAGRGIDVDNLEVVVNYDLPYDPEDYVHRIGRTGRAGREGMAVTFVSGREIYKIPQIERFTKTRIRRERIPTAVQIEERRVDIVFQQVETTLEEGGFKSQSAFVERLLDLGYSSTDIASALLHQLLGGDSDFETPSRKDSGVKAISSILGATPTPIATQSPVMAIKPSIPATPKARVAAATPVIATPVVAVFDAATTPDAATVPATSQDAIKPSVPTVPTVSKVSRTVPITPVSDATPVQTEPPIPIISPAPALTGAVPDISTPVPVKAGVISKPSVPSSPKSVFSRLGKNAKPSFEPSTPRMLWVVLNAGRDDGMTPKEVVDMLAVESGLPPRTVGRIDMTDHSTYALVAEEHVAKMAETITQLEFDGRQLTLQTSSHGGPAMPERPHKKSTSKKPAQE
jgi:hypothetical protein